MITLLTDKEKDAVRELFIASFIDNHFYIEMFPDNRIASLSRIFDSTIEYIIKDNLSYVYKDGNKIIGFLLNIDFEKIKTDPKMRAKIFTGDENNPNPYEQEIDIPVCELNNPIYILSGGVNPEYQNRGICTALLKETIKNNPNRDFAADIANPILCNCMKRLDFQLTEIEDDYFLAIRKQ